MPRRPANPASTASTLALLKEAFLLIALAALVSRVLWAIVGDGWADHLGALFGQYLSPNFPRLAATAGLFLAASAVMGLYRWRRGRTAERPTKATTRPVSQTDSFEVLAYALFGLLCATVLSRGGLDNLSRIVGSDLAARYPFPAKLAGVAVAGLTLFWLIWLVDRRKKASTAGGSVAPPIAALRRLFSGYFTILAVTFGFGAALLLTARVIGALIEAWVLFYPWLAIAFALAALGVVVDSLRPLFRSSQRPSLLIALRETGQSALWIFALCALAVLLLFWNYQGFLESKAVFGQVSRATQVAFFAMPALFSAFVLVTLLLYARAGRRAQVFISFEHAREETAVALAQALGESGLTVQRISFRDDYQHDTLLQAIQEKIRRCDAVVCVPGERPSFVENEILVASALRKFIVFLVGEAEPRLPNTAYYGYPVFRLERVERLKFKPVAELILLVSGNWRASLRYFLDSWTRLFGDAKTLLAVIAVFAGGTYLIGGVLASLPHSGTRPWLFATRFHRAYIDLLGNWTLFWVWLNLFLIGCVFAIVNQVRTRRVLRQETLTGHLTLQVLRKRLGSGKRTRHLLACLWKRPPLAEHELEARRKEAVKVNGAPNDEGSGNSPAGP